MFGTLETIHHYPPSEDPSCSRFFSISIASRFSDTDFVVLTEIRTICSDSARVIPLCRTFAHYEAVVKVNTTTTATTTAMTIIMT